ncbi:uncharacterized protein [Physcomitrium patens]|uniref:uncharacterized protein n=1 Tax=Physcomitrium patens TaxID=3218 RepID=UPI003CCCF7BB
MWHISWSRERKVSKCEFSSPRRIRWLETCTDQRHTDANGRVGVWPITAQAWVQREATFGIQCSGGASV